MGLGIAAGLVGALTAAAPESVAAGSEEGAQIGWEAPAGCPDADALRSRVAEQLDLPLDSIHAQQISIAAELATVDGGFLISLETRTAAGPRRRTVQSPGTCEEATEIAALVIAIAIDEAARPDPAPPVVEEPEPAPVSPADNPPPPQTEAEPPPDDARFRLGARVDGGASVGDLPGFGGTLGGAVALLAPRMRLEIGGRYGFARERHADGSNAGAAFSLWAVVAHGCIVLPAGPVEFPLCAGAEGGVQRAEPLRLDAGNPARSPWGAALAGPWFSWAPVRNFAVVLAVEAVVPFVRRSYAVLIDDAPHELHAPAPVGLRLGLGLEGRLP